jgi:hypothetical protein
MVGHTTNEGNGPRFDQGDVVTFRDNVYEIDRVDLTPDGGVLQYRLESREGPPATLLPAESKDESKGYAVKEFHNVGYDDITVIE